MIHFEEINLPIYDEVISLGHNCATSIALANANLRDNSYPFDWNISTPKNRIKALEDNFKKIIESPNKDMEYGIYFKCHFSNMNKDEFNEMIVRRCNKILNLLNSSSKILFIYSSEHYLHEIEYRNNESIYYNELIDFDRFISSKYQNLNYHILNIGFVKRENIGNIINVMTTYRNIKLYDGYDNSGVNIENNKEISNIWLIYRKFLGNYIEKLNCKNKVENNLKYFSVEN